MEDAHRVLACVDRSHFADHVADYGAWAARRLQAPLEFLHVIDRQPEIARGSDHSGTIGVGAREALLETLASEDEARSRAARDEGRIFLKRLRERALAAGVASADVRQRHGELEETLVEQEADVRLIVLGRRGASAEITRRDLGRNVERVVRALHKPILAVTDDFSAPQRIMIAFDGGSVTRRGVEMVADGALFRGLPVHVLMSGKARSADERQLAWARARLEAAKFDVTAELLPGDAERVIAGAVADRGIDLLVMGAYGHSPLRSLVFGSKTTDLLRSAPVPTLLLR
ncbi:MAG: universal stress protein [Pseudomonadales bacterium]|jgi:nucleotide-binding universal stress UspA family protein|nr:universal stress protein [Pseudomonadales bacterium]